MCRQIRLVGGVVQAPGRKEQAVRMGVREQQHPTGPIVAVNVADGARRRSGQVAHGDLRELGGGRLVLESWDRRGAAKGVEAHGVEAALAAADGDHAHGGHRSAARRRSAPSA
jgi:hypothetical protein